MNSQVSWGHLALTGGLWGHAAWAQLQVLLLTDWAFSGKLLNLSVPRFPPAQHYAGIPWESANGSSVIGDFLPSSSIQGLSPGPSISL